MTDGNAIPGYSSMPVPDMSTREFRTSMEWETPYRLPNLSYCSICGPDSGDQEVVLYKWHWDNQPKGHVMSYCAQHWSGLFPEDSRTDVGH